MTRYAQQSLPAAAFEPAPHPAELPACSDNVDAEWFYALVFVATLGLLAIAIADNAARSAAAWASPLFWLAFSLVVVAFALRLFSRDAGDAERLGLVVVLALFVYAIKLLASPALFTLPDELQHWRTTHSLLTTGHLFEANPILPVSPRYPGLESITAAVCRLTGLSIFAAGSLVVGAARVLLTLALYLVYQRLSGSVRAAGLATLVYVSNPSFLFVDAQYGYESVAIALAASVLCLIPYVAPSSSGVRRARIGAFAIVLLISGVVVTHHITSFFLVAVLMLWAVVERLMRPRTNSALVVRRYALVSLALTLLWTGLVATQTFDYLRWPLVAAARQSASFISQSSGSRHLFQSYGGDVAPRWQQLAATGTVALTLVAVCAGIATLVRRRRTRSYLPLLYVFAGLAVLYPAALALRLAPAGVSVGGRAHEFLFLGVGLVISIRLDSIHAIGIRIAGVGGLLQRAWHSTLPPVLAVAVAGTFIGNAVIGYHPIGFLPGPYLVEGDTRSFDTQAVAVATWTAAVLGPHHRFAGDRAAQLLLGSYGDQRPITVELDKRSVAGLFTTEQWSAFDQAILETDRIGYLWVDHRLSTDVPHVGVWFDSEEPDAFHHDQPIAAEALNKFDALPGAGRVLDAGEIEIVAVGAVTHAQ